MIALNCGVSVRHRQATIHLDRRRPHKAGSIADYQAEAELLAHVRWLADRQAERLSSIEARASSVLGWASAQVALTVAALALIADLPFSWWLLAGAVTVAFGAVASTGAAAISGWGVLRPRRSPAPEVDLKAQRDNLEDRSDEERTKELLSTLVGALTDPASTDTPNAAEPSGACARLESWLGRLANSREEEQPPGPVLPRMRAEVDERARSLRYSTYLLIVAVVLDAIAAAFLAIGIA